MRFIPPPIVPKLKNPPPRPDPNLQKPMVTYFKTERQVAMPFAVRLLISLLGVSLFFALLFGFIVLVNYYPIFAGGSVVGLMGLAFAYCWALDDGLWP